MSHLNINFNVFSESLVKQLVNQIKLFFVTKGNFLFVTTDNTVFHYNFLLENKVLKKFEIFDGNNAIIKFDCSDYSLMTHYMALTDNGGVYSWGYNYDGQLGNGSDDYCDTPTLIDSLSEEFIIDICCGKWHSLVLTHECSVIAFGLGFSECSKFSDTYHLMTVKIIAPKVKSISSGLFYSIALTENGDVFGWDADQVKHNNSKDKERIIPTQLNVPKIKQIKCGPFFSVMLSLDGDIYFCGKIEDCLSNRVPTKLNSNAKFKEIAATMHSELCVVLSEDNKCYIFGSYRDGYEFDFMPTTRRVVNDLHETLFASINKTYALFEQITYKTIDADAN